MCNVMTTLIMHILTDCAKRNVHELMTRLLAIVKLVGVFVLSHLEGGNDRLMLSHKLTLGQVKL